MHNSSYTICKVYAMYESVAELVYVSVGTHYYHHTSLLIFFDFFVELDSLNDAVLKCLPAKYCKPRLSFTITPLKLSSAKLNCFISIKIIYWLKIVLLDKLALVWLYKPKISQSLAADH